jgi:hypothetical protein
MRYQFLSLTTTPNYLVDLSLVGLLLHCWYFIVVVFGATDFLDPDLVRKGRSCLTAGDAERHS